ncbi:MAG: ABC transporter ATP-binding protein, partial [Bacteroidia bacterium]|nr:ABC transporter ATP-binding protein [Bacteroidia bacterium]
LLGGCKLSRSELIQRLERVGLAARAHSKVKTFSQGMKQRLGLAVALVSDPELIILDEPVNGLDPQGIADIRELILHLSHEEHKTVFVSSHLLAEMEMIAGRMLIIDKGKKVIEGSVKELLNPEKTVVELQAEDADKVSALIQASSWKSFFRTHNRGKVLLEMNTKDIPQLNRFLVEHGVAVHSLKPKHTLEDYFLSLTR